jgi:hypothetical protein
MKYHDILETYGSFVVQRANESWLDYQVRLNCLQSKAKQPYMNRIWLTYRGKLNVEIQFIQYASAEEPSLEKQIGDQNLYSDIFRDDIWCNLLD